MRIRNFVLLLPFVFIGMSSALAEDMVIFHNGERRFGDAVIVSGSDLVLTKGAYSKRYFQRQVKEIIYGFSEADYMAQMVSDVTAPATADLDSATEIYVPYQSSGLITDITGANVYRKKMTTPRGKSYVVDVEEYFDVGSLQVAPMSYGFFGRRGTFVRASILNRVADRWHPLTLRVFLFGEDGLLQTRDVYVFRLPGSTDGSIGRRVIEANFPDVPYEAVTDIRIVRRF